MIVVRSGARFTCHGDGLCCTDAHSLGPLSLREQALVGAISPAALLRKKWLATSANGGCVFLDHGLCALHARLGEAQKPRTCRRFPFSLVRTPHGTRVVTEHRCPCRSMGERAAIVADDVPLGPATLAPNLIALDEKTSVPFAMYAHDVEAPLLESLSPPLATRTKRDWVQTVIGPAFPPLDSISWGEAGEWFRAMKDGTPVGSSHGEAMVAFGDVLRRPDQVPIRARLWAGVFDRAEARTPRSGDPSAMLADFVADELWSLDFAIRGTSLAVARAELATRAAVAVAYADALAAQGVRGDRAMGEAIMIVELAGRTELWARLVTQLRT